MKIILNLGIAIMGLCGVGMAQSGYQFHSYPSAYSMAELINKNDMKADAQGNIWIAFRDIGLAKYDGASWVFYNTLNSGLPSDTVYSIAFDAQNNVWAGTGNGLANFDGSNWTVYTPVNSGIPENALSLKVSGSNIWCGTNEGAAVFDGVSWTLYNNQNSGIAGDTVTAIHTESNGTVWFGTLNMGISSFYNGIWTTYNTSNSGLGSDSINKIEITPADEVFVTSAGNNNLYKFSGGIMYDFIAELYDGVVPMQGYRFPVCTDLAGDIIFPVRSPYGHYYVCTIDHNSIHLNSYSETYPVASGGFVNPHCAVDNNGVLLYTALADSSGSYGLISFNPNNHIPLPFVQTNENSKFLDINQVKAAVLNRGDMHWNLSSPSYEVPAGQGRQTVFASGFWMGGLDPAEQVYASAQTYRQTGIGFWPGPLDSLTLVVDTAMILFWDRIWKINRSTIEDFKYHFMMGNVTNGTYPVPSEILTWPAIGAAGINRELAPFVDFNFDSAYDPFDGDYPLIRGDQMLFWIINDITGNVYGIQQIPGAGMETHCSAYAYYCDQLPDSQQVMGHTTFYHFRTFNRGIVSYHDFYMSLFSDMDSGISGNYTGCDSMLNAGFSYGSNTIDTAYVQNILILRGPAADAGDLLDNDHNGVVDEPFESCGLNGFVSYINMINSPAGHPNGKADYYNYMKSVWLDNIPITYGDDGRNFSNPPTSFMFSGTPYDTAGWWEGSSATGTVDRRMLLNSGPFTFLPGEAKTIDFAYVYSRDTSGPNGINTSIARNRADLQRVQSWFDNSNFPSCLVVNPAVAEIQDDGFDFIIFPNPVNSLLNVMVTGEIKNHTYRISDNTGREVISGLLPPGGISVHHLAEGMYFMMITAGDKQIVKKFIKY